MINPQRKSTVCVCGLAEALSQQITNKIGSTNPQSTTFANLTNYKVRKFADLQISELICEPLGTTHNQSLLARLAVAPPLHVRFFLQGKLTTLLQVMKSY
jgi:hypothetical protein